MLLVVVFVSVKCEAVFFFEVKKVLLSEGKRVKNRIFCASMTIESANNVHLILSFYRHIISLYILVIVEQNVVQGVHYSITGTAFFFLVFFHELLVSSAWCFEDCLKMLRR